MDNHTKEQRRKNMQAVKNKDSQIEIILRKELWKRAKVPDGTSNVFFTKILVFV